MAEGRTALEKQEFPAALARFRLVDRDAPKFQGVDALIADTIAKQQKAVDIAIDSGQQNEHGRQVHRGQTMVRRGPAARPGLERSPARNAPPSYSR